MNVKSCALCLLAVGFLFVSHAASPSDWTQLQPLSPNMITASGLDGNGKSALLPGGFRPSTSAVKTILFIDPSVADADTLLDGLDPSTVVIRLNAKTDGLSQIADALAEYSHLDAIHILSHGSTGKLFLGSSTVNRANLADHAKQLAKIGSALGENGDILLYGCDVAQGETGNLFIRSLAQYTGADVAASTNLTGSKTQGGDWMLDASTGGIEAGQVFAEDSRQSYSHVLNYSDDYDLALMSQMAYNDNPQSVAGWNVVWGSPTAVGEFFAVAFQKDDRIVIAYRGTDRIGETDLSADLAIGNPRAAWDAEFDEAIRFAEMIQVFHPYDHISVTGHSLGGSLAQVAAQMFGFDGATFDPGGALNLTWSDEFKKWAIDLKRVHPSLKINQGPDSAFTNYIVADSVVSGWTGDPIGKTEQLDFFAYATTEEIVIKSSTFIAHFALDKFKLGFLADAVTAALTTNSFHRMEGILDLMSIRKENQITAELQQKYQQTIQQAANTGDVVLPVSSNTSAQTVFYSTSYNPYVFTNNIDSTIYGTDGKDIIYSFAGNDKVYAGGGDDTISTAQGNDVIEAGDGSDTVYAGSGDDVIDLGKGNGSADGGAGRDTLTFDLSDRTGWLFLGVGTPSTGYAGYTGDSSFEQLRQGLAGATAFKIYNGTYLVYANAEAVNWKAGSGNDLVVFQGGTSYDGGGGTDTFYAEWSGTTQSVNWDVDGNSLSAVDGVTVANVERLLMVVGSGDDHFKATKGGLSHHIETGLGRDSVELGVGSDYIDTGGGDDNIKAGDGDDTVNAGSGDDVIDLGKGSGTVDGGAGFDTLTFDLSDRTGWLSLGVGTPSTGYAGYTGDSSFEQLRQGLAGATAFKIYNGAYLVYANAEAVNWKAGSGNDLVVFQGGTSYDGGGGTDTFYADWSSSTTNIIWANDPAQTQTVHGLEVSGLERLLLATGNGNDILTNITVNTDDVFITGAGDDTVNAGGGNDRIEGGTGNNRLSGGSGADGFVLNALGNDTITDFSKAENDQLDLATV